jgi:hypothetical protein
MTAADAFDIYEILRAGGSMTPREVAAILEVNATDVEQHLELEALTGVIQYRDGAYSAWR